VNSISEDIMSNSLVLKQQNSCGLQCSTIARLLPASKCRKAAAAFVLGNRSSIICWFSEKG